MQLACLNRAVCGYFIGGNLWTPAISVAAIPRTMAHVSAPGVRAKAIKEVALYAARPRLFRLDVLPFAALYGALIAAAVNSWLASEE